MGHDDSDAAFPDRAGRVEGVDKCLILDREIDLVEEIIEFETRVFPVFEIACWNL